MLDYQIIISAKDAPNKKDASGAFIPWGMAHARYLTSAGKSVAVTLLDLVSKSASAEDFKPCHTLIFYGHGYKHGLQLVKKKHGGLKELAWHLKKNGVQNLYAYACSFLGSQDDTLDEFMRDAELRRLWGHTTAGHCAWNPNMVWLSCGKVKNASVFSYDRTITKLSGKQKAKIRSLIQATRNEKEPLFARLPELTSGELVKRLWERDDG